MTHYSVIHNKLAFQLVCSTLQLEATFSQQTPHFQPQQPNINIRGHKNLHK